MVDPAVLGAAFTAGLLSAASPCVLAAGMVVAFVGLGLAAARLGMFFGTLGPGWTAFGGAVIVAAGVLLFTGSDTAALCPNALRGWMQAHFGNSGLPGALVLGALTGTVLTPCATPVLGAALALAGSGGALGGSAVTGALMLLAYAIGRSPLLILAGLAPQSLNALITRLGAIERFLPGHRAFSVLMMGAGLWLVLQSGFLIFCEWSFHDPSSACDCGVHASHTCPCTGP